MKVIGYFLACFLLASDAQAFDVATTRLEPATNQAFDQYVRGREAEMQARPRFLWCDGRESCLSTVKLNEVMVAPHSARGVEAVPGGLIHDWQGTTFVPGVNLDETLTLLRNYEHHKQVYAPEVIDSKLLSRDGDHSRVYLRLRKKKIITVILKTEYDKVFGRGGLHARAIAAAPALPR